MKRHSPAALATLALIALWSTVLTAQEKADPFAPIRFLVGDWVGQASGEPGTGTARRSYSFVLEHRYLHERNVTTYAAQADKPGEVHEHWSFFSYDRARRSIVLRQFHPEGFVNQYVLDTAASTPKRLVFDSERFENFDNTWRARETYDIESPAEFTETFELGAPGKELQVYSRTRFRRVPSPPAAGEAGAGHDRP